MIRWGYTVLALALLPSARLLAGQVQGAPPARTSAADLDKGRALFIASGCNSCHLLADAHAVGDLGPGLDHNDAITAAFVQSRVADGYRGMPGYRGRISDSDIALLTSYIVQVAQK